MRSINKVAAIGVFDAQIAEYMFDLRGLLGLLVVFILADFWWGSRESKYNGEQWRFSRAWRRTLNKFIDYITYVLIGGALSYWIGVPMGVTDSAQAGMAVGIGLGLMCEADSVVKHAFAVHGIRFSFRRLLISLLRLHRPDWGQAVDEALEEK